MDNPAKLSDVENSIERPLTDDETRVIPSWLDRAWRELNRVVPGIPQRTALDPSSDQHLETADVRDVIVAMVERKVRNPDGRRSWGGDDFTEQIDSSMSSGQLYVSDSERASLLPRFAAPGGFYSIPLAAR